jgi:hypothetical protein
VLKWICDVAELVERYRSELDWWAIQQEAARSGSSECSVSVFG